MHARASLREIPNTHSVTEWALLPRLKDTTQDMSVKLTVSSPGGTIRLHRATACCPPTSARCSSACKGFRHSLAILSSNPGATQQCSTMAGRMNVRFWRCCLEFLVWLEGRLKDGKNAGELVAPLGSQGMEN